MEQTRTPKFTAKQKAERDRCLAHMQAVQERQAAKPFKVADGAGCVRAFDTEAEAEAWIARVA